MTPSAVRCLAATMLIALLANAPAGAQGDALDEANRLFAQGRLEQALDRVDGHLRTRPKDARGRFLRGLILAEQDRTDEAIRAFTDLTREYPELPEPHNNLAVLYASRGQYDEARAALEMAIRTHPSYATAHENLGDIYAKMASQAYDKALALDRKNSTAQTKLNLIKDLFTGAPSSSPSMAPAVPGKLAAIEPSSPPKAEPPAPPAKPAQRQADPVKAPPAVKTDKPEATAAAPAVRPDGSAEVLEAVNDWAAAWSSNDIERYLGHYAADFETPKGQSRDQWEKQRRARIARPRRIRVEIDSPRVTRAGDGRATVTFLQRYRSGALNLSSMKTLEMVRSAGRWLIRQERIGG